uniref:Serine/threonine-protein kinase PLK n=1 Tax=Trichuris muris TaxID=70415 RepID=A0A5S6QX90_TRIMR
MDARGNKKEMKELPDVIVNPADGTRYIKGKFLGKGGFARCYELTDSSTNEVFAGKVVSKSLLLKKHQKEKIAQEIEIHRNLCHENIVKFYKNFEDDDNVYILLELCRRRSLMELHKRRRTITEPEARYFLVQIINATVYLHNSRIIHRDMKLGNLFLNDNMVVKLGDFGLATILDFDGERKRTLCGTPNYIAPEVLCKKGHSYEVDVWAIGCILYTLLVGKPPFETDSLKDTYARIQRNEYHIPSRLSQSARHMIQRTLQTDPRNRPPVRELLKFQFICNGFRPHRLPTSCLTMAPKFPVEALSARVNVDRKPFAEINKPDQNKVIPAVPNTQNLRTLNAVPEGEIASDNKQQLFEMSVSAKQEMPSDCYMSQLYKQLLEFVQIQPGNVPNPRQDEAEDPASAPVFWVSRWVDYSDKYGLGYQLCDNSVGVLFNDDTKLVLNSDGKQLQYIQRNGQELFFTMDSFPDSLTKKATLLKYFKCYMNDHLLKAGAGLALREGDELARLPCLRTWFRTRSAIVLHLNNGTVQVNFFHDHTKIILCPLMGAVTFLDENRNFKTYKLVQLQKYGCDADLAARLRYAKSMIERLIVRSSSTGQAVLASLQLKTAAGSTAAISATQSKAA